VRGAAESEVACDLGRRKQTTGLGRLDGHGAAGQNQSKVAQRKAAKRSASDADCDAWNKWWGMAVILNVSCLTVVIAARHGQAWSSFNMSKATVDHTSTSRRAIATIVFAIAAAIYYLVATGPTHRQSKSKVK
jgi:hypothetical protein